MNEFLIDVDKELAKIEKDMLKDFHAHEKETKIKYCKEHNRECINCTEGCEVKDARLAT